MSHRTGLLGSSVLLGSTRIGERAGSLVVALLLSRHIGAEGLGIYVTVIAYFQLLALAGELGAGSLLVREMARTPELAGRWATHAAALAAVLSAAVVGAVWIVVPHLGLDAEIRLGVLVAVVAVLPTAMAVIAEAAFVALGRLEILTGLSISASVALVISAAVLLASGGGVTSLIVSFVVVRASFGLLGLWAVSRYVCPLSLDLDRGFCRHVVRELRPFAGSALIGGLFARPELILLTILGTPTQVGHFGAASKVVDVWQLVPQAFMTNVYPLLSRSYEVGDGVARALEQRARRVLVALGLLVTVVILVGADAIVAILFGSDFRASATLLRILALSTVLYGVHSVLWRTLSARGDQHVVLRIQVVTLVGRVAGSIVLIHAFGAAGAAVAVPLAFAAHNALLSSAIRRERAPAARTPSTVSGGTS